MDKRYRNINKKPSFCHEIPSYITTNNSTSALLAVSILTILCVLFKSIKKTLTQSFDPHFLLKN